MDGKIGVQVLYIPDCPSLLKTREVLREVMKGLGAEAEVEALYGRKG